MANKFKISSKLVLVIIATTLLIPNSTIRVHADSPPALAVFSEDTNSTSIVNANLISGTNFTIDITASNLPAITNRTAGGLEGFDISLSYNSSILKVSKMSFASPLCPSTADCAFDYPTNSTLTYANSIDSASGTARLAMIVLAQSLRAQPQTSPGKQTVLFRTIFLVVGRGLSPITIKQDTTRLMGYEKSFCQPISSFTAQNGSFDNRPPFYISANPSSLSVLAGKSGSTTISVNATRPGETVNATLVLSGILPAHKADYTFVPRSRIIDATNPNFASNLTITTSSSSQPGTYTLEIVAAVPDQGQGNTFRLPFILTITNPLFIVSSQGSARVLPPPQTSLIIVPGAALVTTPLLVTFSYTSNPLTGVPVVFSTTVWCGTPSYSFSWTFGDGTTETGNTTTHTFTSPRPYAVTLTVTDSQGQTFTSQQIVDVSGTSPAATFDLMPVSAAIAVLLVFGLISFVFLMRRRKKSR